jgi:hypothetical protein
MLHRQHSSLRPRSSIDRNEGTKPKRELLSDRAHSLRLIAQKAFDLGPNGFGVGETEEGLVVPAGVLRTGGGQLAGEVLA